MRVLVMGGTGMLGHKVFQRLRTRLPETCCTIRGSRRDSPAGQISLFADSSTVVEDVDVLDWPSVEAVLSRLRPEVVVNCVGIVKQRPDAKAAIPSITINALLPHKIAAVLDAWGGRLIHVSTDCVFSGERGSYREDDPSDARDLYGRSKFLGEVAHGRALTLRTSMIGRELTGHRSLLDWVLRQAGRIVHGYQRAFYSGLTTNELANVILMLIERQPDLAGLYQVASQTITKYDLVRLIVETYRLDIQVEPDSAFFCDRSLIGQRFVAATGYQCPSWPELIQALYADPTPYNDWARQA